MLTVSLRQGGQFVAEPEDDLVTAGLKAGIYIEHSCRIGRCNSCKGRLIRGETKALRSQSGLSAAELANGYILTCCHSAQSDLLLDAEYLDVAPIPSALRPSKIDSLTFSGSIALLTLRLPPAEKFVYYPGQYVQLARGAAPPRSYSIANGPRGDGKLEFHIKRQPGGLFSDYLFNEAKAGDLLKLIGPRGSFFHRTSKPPAM